jgi:hypothetical protein
MKRNETKENMMAKRLKGIESQIAYLFDQVRRLHEAIGTHEWIKSYAPWSDGEPWHVTCLCGANKDATKVEYDAADTFWDGY